MKNIQSECLCVCGRENKRIKRTVREKHQKTLNIYQSPSLRKHSIFRASLECFNCKLKKPRTRKNKNKGLLWKHTRFPFERFFPKAKS